jgi:hydroxymethylbilane synthase
VTERIVIGTRGSKLALWQSEYVARTLTESHRGAVEVELRTFSTKGDRILDKPLPEIGGKGLFTAELEEALHGGDIDLAVHSLKDLPTEQPEGLALLGIPVRADARDALVVRVDHVDAFMARAAQAPESYEPRDPLASLPEGAVVGTSSLRRAAQLKALRPDLVVQDIRGNVDTRLRKLDEGGYDAILLACAGLDRLGLGERITRRLDPPWLSAAGQGAIAVQGRAGDGEVAMLLNPLENKPTRLEVKAERGVLALLGGGCSLPLGVRCVANRDRLSIDAVLLDPQGTVSVRGHRVGEATLQGAERVGRMLVRDLLDRGAAKLLPEESA